MTIHVSETEAVHDFANLLARVREGAEVIIEANSVPVATIRNAQLAPRSLSSVIAQLEASASALGHEPIMGREFVADMEQVVNGRSPRDTSEWD